VPCCWLGRGSGRRDSSHLRALPKYTYEYAVDLGETLNDVGDIFCPANITKAHDQISAILALAVWRSAWTARSGSSTSTDTWTRNRRIWARSCTPAPGSTRQICRTAPPANLVQLGIGGWQVPRSGVKVERERGTTCLTVSEIEKIGVDKTIEIGLQVALKRACAVYFHSTSTQWMSGSCLAPAGRSRAASLPLEAWRRAGDLYKRCGSGPLLGALPGKATCWKGTRAAGIWTRPDRN
jgi:hypothetical protein